MPLFPGAAERQDDSRQQTSSDDIDPKEGTENSGQTDHPDSDEQAAPEETSHQRGGPSETTPSVTQEPEPVLIQLAAVGDLLMHRPITDGGLVNPDTDPPAYDFRPNFKFIKASIMQADEAIFNLETTLAGPPYTGYPRFSAPDAVAEALLDTGFTLASTANNHILDKDQEGFFRTTKVLRDIGFHVIGTRLSTDEPRDIILDISGIITAFTAYTFETPGTPSQRTLNSLPIPDEIHPLLNSFNPYRQEAYEADLERMLEHIEDMKLRGAELICMSIHWGEEYQTESRPYQREMAQKLADAGVQVIFGHHPHVLQEIDILVSAQTGESTVVYYSLGNLVTNMTNEVPHAAGWSQDSMIARVVIQKDNEGVKLVQAQYVPAHIIRVPEPQGRRHYVVPVLPALEEPESFYTTREVMRKSLERINQVMKSIPEDGPVPIRQVPR